MSEYINNVTIEVNWRDFAGDKKDYTRNELAGIIRQIRSYADTEREKLRMAMAA